MSIGEYRPRSVLGAPSSIAPLKGNGKGLAKGKLGGGGKINPGRGAGRGRGNSGGGGGGVTLICGDGTYCGQGVHCGDNSYCGEGYYCGDIFPYCGRTALNTQ